MATPRVFISSTCYDLKYIRENLKFFIHTLGYEPVLSEEGSVFYDPEKHVQDACLAEVPACQLFVLIIGGRFGSRYKTSVKSITNQEFIEAVKAKVPVFALVEQGVYDQYFVFMSNKTNKDVDPTKIRYPSVDSTFVFDFIAEVQGQAINNALFPFSDFEHIQRYLKQQWASMFHAFLYSQQEVSRLRDLLNEMAKTNEKIEFLSRQLLATVGNPITQVRVKAYDLLIAERISRYLSDWGIKPTPDAILQNKNLDDICEHRIITADKEDPKYGKYSWSHGGPPYKAGSVHIEMMRKQYDEAREHTLTLLKNEGVSPEEFMKVSQPRHSTDAQPRAADA